MYVGVTTAVRMEKKVRNFEEKVGMQQGQGYVLSPLLTIVLEALSRHFRKGLPCDFFTLKIWFSWHNPESD